MLKVAWPRWSEVRRYAIIVLITVVAINAFVGGDWMQFLACFQADFIKTEWRMYD